MISANRIDSWSIWQTALETRLDATQLQGRIDSLDTLGEEFTQLQSQFDSLQAVVDMGVDISQLQNRIDSLEASANGLADIDALVTRIDSLESVIELLTGSLDPLNPNTDPPVNGGSSLDNLSGINTIGLNANWEGSITDDGIEVSINYSGASSWENATVEAAIELYVATGLLSEEKKYATPFFTGNFLLTSSQDSIQIPWSQFIDLVRADILNTFLGNFLDIITEATITLPDGNTFSADSPTRISVTSSAL